jgi:phage baseplate assembly protein W
MATDVIFRDLPINFDVHPIKGDMIMITNEQAVKRSIINLLLTNPYERFFTPNLGSGIRASLFENLNKDSEYFLKEKIIEVIKNYEKRANLYSVNVKALPDSNTYNVTIVFFITNSTQPITLSVVLRRVR